MNFLLKMSSWKLFLLLFLLSFFTFIPALTLPYLIVYVGWVYSVGAAMHNLIPNRIKPRIEYFKFSCIFSIIASISIPVLGTYNSGTAGLFSWILIPVAFYTFWSFIYIASFASRMLESVIEGEIVSVSDSIKGIFCFLVFPFGVWHIQPAVKRVSEKYKDQIKG